MYLRDYSWAAGGFYPTDAASAGRQIDECMAAPSPALEGAPLLVAGVVPHAGWVYSGKTAGKVFKKLLERKVAPKTAVCFGSVHVPGVRKPAIVRDGAWRTPLGDIPIDADLATRILDELKNSVQENNSPNEEEHSIEVVLPFLKRTFPEVRIVPIMVPPDEGAAKLGEEIGKMVKGGQGDVIFIGSSDLTHYGSRFGFTPAGKGAKAVQWVKEENDRRLIDLALKMQASEIVTEARSHMSACGPGAIAATVAAAKVLGATRGFLLEQTTSYDVQPSGGADTFVGYAGIVF